MKICGYIYNVANYVGFGLLTYSMISGDKYIIPLAGIILMFGIGGLILMLVGFMYTFFLNMLTSDKVNKYLDDNSLILIIANVITIGILLGMTKIKGEDFIMVLLLANVVVMCNILRGLGED